MAAHDRHFLTTWEIPATTAEKVLLRRLSFVMKPLFGRDHQWAMERRRRSLSGIRPTRRTGMWWAR